MLYNFKTTNKSGFQAVQYALSKDTVYFLLERYKDDNYTIKIYDVFGNDVTEQFGEIKNNE